MGLEWRPQVPTGNMQIIEGRLLKKRKIKKCSLINFRADDAHDVLTASFGCGWCNILHIPLDVLTGHFYL